MMRVVAVLAACGIAEGFVVSSAPARTSVAVNAGGYMEARRAAAAARANGGAPVATPAPITPAAPPPPAPKVVPGEPAPSEAISDVLAVLGSRIASTGQPLTDVELSSFVGNLDAVIATLDGPQVSEQPVRYEGADEAAPEMEDDEVMYF
mmetsp:Transcript_18241/g.55918  ORF Transcript_18241/g.55918 Transcript_18241/m.55918 type:complete len:150 (+) Transcript_18241:131-580(+)